MRINNFHSNVASYISKNKIVQKTLLSVEKNPAMVNSLICAGIGIVAKPATILLMPSKDKEVKRDKQYSIARAVSTGLIDFVFALALFIPLNKRIDKAGRKLYNSQNTIYYHNKQMVTNAKSIMNRGLRFITLPLFAICKFCAIDPTVKMLFKKDKEKINDNKNRTK